MQYWKPDDPREFAGDMMPFWDGTRFHLFYLLDRDHHAERDGLGGHHWAHASTADLVKWTHHPLAIPRGVPGAFDQNGICTGSILEVGGVYMAFYACRIRRSDGSVYEAICRADGADLVHFEKRRTPLFAAPPELDARNLRDPFVFRHPETGRYQMLVSASRPAGRPGDGPERGVLAHFTSADLEDWEYEGPFLALDADPVPECPEHFFWNGWWYLLYSQHQQMRYWVSKGPLGPWQRVGGGTIEGPNLTVPRTAAFGDRRLAAGFLPWRAEDRDEAWYVYAGSVVFRELLQSTDGSLTTQFAPELMPPAKTPRRLPDIVLDAASGYAAKSVPSVPTGSTLTVRFTCEPGIGEYGLLLRADDDGSTGYRLTITPRESRVTLRRWPDGGALRAEIAGLEGLGEGTEIVVCQSGSILDLCVNSRRTAAERVFDFAGTSLVVFARAGTLTAEMWASESAK